MISSEAQGETTKTVPTSKAERAAFVLREAEILDLTRMAVTFEDHYGLPMDMEWPATQTRGMIDLATPSAAFRWR